MRHFILSLMVLATASLVHADDAKKVKYSGKTQKVDFENQDIDGKLNSPDGAYLLQKRGVQFLPLYKVNNQFEKNILESVEYLR
jgi:hypothetical protein